MIFQNPPAATRSNCAFCVLVLGVDPFRGVSQKNSGQWISVVCGQVLTSVEQQLIHQKTVPPRKWTCHPKSSLPITSNHHFSGAMLVFGRESRKIIVAIKRLCVCVSLFWIMCLSSSPCFFRKNGPGTEAIDFLALERLVDISWWWVENFKQNGNLKVITLTETNSSPLKMDDWKMLPSPFGMAYFQSVLVSFRECERILLLAKNQVVHCWRFTTLSSRCGGVGAGCRKLVGK